MAVGLQTHRFGLLKWRSASAVLGGLLSLFLCLIILPLNNGPLYYIDTGGYFSHGASLIGEVQDIFISPALEHKSTASEVEPRNETVVGSRSAVYAIFLALVTKLGGVSSVGFIQSLAFLLSVFLPIRIAGRAQFIVLDSWKVLCLAVVAACLGSAPFYTVYLMPDIFTPILIFCVATLAAFSGRMLVWEIVVIVMLGGLSVMMHPSHLLLIAALIPITLVVLFFLKRDGQRWILFGLICAIFSVGIVERYAFKTAVETIKKATVVYYPFLTVRMIVDGPGMQHLGAVCTSSDLVTCELYAMLESDPRRIDASLIMFATDPKVGSLRLLDEEKQRQIAGEQSAFVAAVVTSRPFSVARSVALNTVEQMLTNSIIMTLPADTTLEKMRSIASDIPQELENIRWADDAPWLRDLERFHNTLYIVSATLLLFLLILPRYGPPARMRVFAVLVFAGVVANALVCSGISQPAERYGARVIFLLPMLVVFLVTSLPAFGPKDR